MGTTFFLDSREPWRARLVLPAYQLAEAARYVNVSPQTVWAWHKRDDRKVALLAPRDARSALSYLQLIEVAIVATLRRKGMKLDAIRRARDYMQRKLESDFPFALQKFKTDNRHIWLEWAQVEEGVEDPSKLVAADMGGQEAFGDIVRDRLEEFSYSHGIAAQWRPAGKKSKIVIDPRVSFGAPTIKGVATWAVHGRWKAHEPIASIAEDFQLDDADVKEALKFEGVSLQQIRSAKRWYH